MRTDRTHGERSSGRLGSSTSALSSRRWSTLLHTLARASGRKLPARMIRPPLTREDGKPRILWVCKGLDEGGVETLLVELARQHILRRYSLHVAHVLTSRDQLAPQLKALGVEVHDLGGTRTMDPRWVLKLSVLLSRLAFPVVHSHSPLPAAACRVLARVTAGRPATLTTEHGVRSLYHPATRLLNDTTAHLDTQRIAVSRAAARQETRWDRRPIEVLYHGVGREGEGSAPPGLRATLGVQQDDLLVIAIANLRPEKNLQLLIRAFASAASGDPHARLSIIGEGSQRPMLEAVINELGAGDKVTLHGRLSKARRFLRVADLAALSSTSEALPVFLLECLQAGLPVVATQVGGVEEIIIDGHNGFLTTSGDVTGFSARLSILLRDPLLRRTMSEASVRMSQQFSIEVAGERMHEIYRQIITDRDASVCP